MAAAARGGGLCLALAGLTMMPGTVAAQETSVRLLGVDMYGGIVVPRDSRLGVSFSARLGLVAFADRVRLGPALDWWTAERCRHPVDTRVVVVHIDAWTELPLTGWMRPHAGLGVGLHSVDAAVDDPLTAPAGAEELAESLDGNRFGAAGFGGASFRLTGTGALWLIAEYRYTVARRISNHQLGVGVRLSVSEL